jgi:BlaI family transcriptional regulator, penicillinase repressor
MMDKGLLYRDIVDRSHIYRPSENPAKVQGQVVRGLRDLAFGGSTSSLVLSALGDGEIPSQDELEQIKQRIAELEKLRKQ